MTFAAAGDCPFCAISREYAHVAQEQQKPSKYPPEDATHVILSTPHTIAFLDQLPLTRCHTLLIPRKHFELLSDIPSEIAAEVGRMLPIVCRAVLEVSGADGFNIVQNNGISAGQVVPHSHFHIVPRYREHSSASMFGKGDREELDDEEGKEISRRMRQVVERELLREKARL